MFFFVGFIVYYCLFVLVDSINAKSQSTVLPTYLLSLPHTFKGLYGI